MSTEAALASTAGGRGLTVLLVDCWLFRTRIRHQNNKFVNFLTAGIRIGHNRTDHKLETSEVCVRHAVVQDFDGCPVFHMLS